MKTALVLVALVCLAPAARAYEVAPRFVLPGTPVRVTSAEGRLAGTYLGLDADSLRIALPDSAGVRAIPLAGVERLRARTETANAAVPGFLVGALAGGLIGMAAGKGYAPALAGCAGAFVGTLVGAGVPVEHWTDVPRRGAVVRVRF